jgi:hypothetical protein
VTSAPAAFAPLTAKSSNHLLSESRRGLPEKASTLGFISLHPFSGGLILLRVR